MLTKEKRIPRILVIILTLAMLVGALTIGASASVPTYNGVAMQFGDPNYSATLPESLMTITGSGTSYTANYTGTDSAYYYPNTLCLYAYYSSSNTTLETSGGVQIATYSDGVETLHSSLTPSTNVNEGVASDVYTVKLTAAGTVTIKDGSPTMLTLSFSAPKADFPSSHATPNALMGYLPLGQYATGSAWGSPYSNGTTTTGTTPKIVGAYSSTGVSLGAAGGYVQYSFANPIPNTATNPNGVDFIVYGNAFNGNPEAAAVKVSSDGTTWYDLAGSLYYAANTIRNASITYTLSGTDILYSITAPQLSAAITGTFKSGSAGWYPNTTTEYGGVWQISGATVGASAYSSTSVTYSNVTLVKDTDTTNDYQFGYADVHSNGSSYGTAVNPYTITNTASGGDSFDISWAVNTSGQPINLSSIQYVRVYTAAAMNSTGTAMTVPSIFGETSAEVCGIYAVSGTGSGAATADLVVKRGSAPVTGITNMGTKTISLAANTYTFNIYSDDDSVYVNGVSVAASTTSTTPYAYSVTVAANETKNIQIITQSGTESPFVTVISITGT